jgi:diacylglycerol kinase (ATP)
MFQEKINRVHLAFRAIIHALQTELSIKIQLASTVVMVLLGVYFHIQLNEWRVLLLAYGMVLGVELLNTAIENACDALHPDYNEQIGIVKDLAAGASFVIGLVAIWITGSVFMPYFFM